MDFARPPWGWSTGFRATPRTCGFNPKLRQYPDFVLVTNRLFFKATAPSDANAYTENVFLTPEGNCNNAVWSCMSNLINLADVPALRTYWIPRWGYSSSRETFDKRFTYIKTNNIGSLIYCCKKLDFEGKYVKSNNLNLSVDCKYVIPPEAKKDKATNLFWKGIKRKVPTTERKRVLRE